MLKATLYVAFFSCPFMYKACVLSHVQFFVTPWTVVRQAPVSMEFSRQEHSSGLPFYSRDSSQPRDQTVRWVWQKRECSRQSGREWFIIGRKQVSGFREKPVLSLYSQPFLCPINVKLCPEGRGPLFIFSLQLGSCDHVVRGVSWSGGHIVLRNWHQQGKTGYRLKEETGCHQGNVTTVTSSLVCQVTIMGYF